jgi:plastocyanin
LNTTAIIIAVVVFFLYTGQAISGDEQRTHIVTITNFQFVPAEITVKVGDTIRWINQDFIPHTATANDKSWDSKLINPDEEWELIVESDFFSSYFCLYHPSMKAKILIDN